jgi:hypothetical protein
MQLFWFVKIVKFKYKDINSKSQEKTEFEQTKF